MTLWGVAALPVLAGAILWLAARASSVSGGTRSRTVSGVVAVAGMAGTLALALWAAAGSAGATVAWGGGLTLSLEVTAAVRVAMVLVPAIALAVVSWAAAHESTDGLARLLSLLLAFVGAMELLVLAGDLLTLAIAWELVAAVSWALIGHRWRVAAATGAAVYAFNATRLGGLGLWVAAGASLAVTGGFGFAGLQAVAASPWGHAFAAAVLVAAAAKSAQGPFAPWLFRAMEGPSSVSALLHSSTMVAAGAWLLIRLQAPLDAVPWFGPAAVATGLLTALAGGVVAAVQPHAKRLLAASTSAQYGLMFAAVGAGFPGVALAHLVAHAAFKALLFLVAGSAITEAGSALLRDMRVGGRLPGVAAAGAVAALALAAFPPLGGAWTKEQIVAATGALSPWLAVATIGAGALSAWYAARFHLLAFGRRPDDDPRAPEPAVLASVWLLAGLSLALGALWLPAGERAARALLPGELPPGHAWELVASVASVVLAAGAAWLAYAKGLLAPAPLPDRAREVVAGWLGLPAGVRAVAVTPVRFLAAACARFDDRVVDAGLRLAAAIGRGASKLFTSVVEEGVIGLVDLLVAATRRMADRSRRSDDHGIDAVVRSIGRGIGRAGTDSRRLQTGSVPTYYDLLVAGALVLALVLALWR